jgi:hypothetical protein
MKTLNLLRKWATKKEAPAKARPKATLEMVVTRADGSKEIYVADEKGQRRIG